MNQKWRERDRKRERHILEERKRERGKIVAFS